MSWLPKEGFMRRLVIALPFLCLGVAPGHGKSCEEAIDEIAVQCMLKKGVEHGAACRKEAQGRLQNCRNFQGEMADFRGTAKQGWNDPEGNVYKSCEDKRRENYVLDKDEIDYCGGLPRRK
ncbi:hypothetical protein EET67_12530 [Pseudaminobacter arsenicus]|uniref:Uncharacterized protein n=1 Tax=Borborobacter arsenicus TaxID=1851146 RepID=A0A432V5Q9_9HYPH|nr:hypothetical protein [Pseudaminobacter arsenicus]RUM97478.1 hypothetical protein EET67_12530 [Pseudaminobacter arsenicus]